MNRKSRKPAPPPPRTLPRVLKPGSPEQIRRDELLAIINDPNRSDGERYAAVIESLPLCYQRVCRAVPIEPVPFDPTFESDDPDEILTRLLAAQGLRRELLQ
jgi:hypothetical protein